VNPFAFVLLRPQPVQMLNPVGHKSPTWPNIIVAEEFRPNRCRRSMTSSQSSLIAFMRRNPLAHAIHQNLSATARGIEPSPACLNREITLRAAN